MDGLNGLDGPGGGTPRSEPLSGLTRREALRRGALVGSALWMVPVAQAVSVTPAAADTASAPGGGGGGGGRPVTVPPGQAVGRSGSRPNHVPGPHAHPVRRRRRVRHRHGRG
ncbi:MAG: hypothetical protein ACTHOD_06695 [Motilibacteraceae bacterium]